MNDDDRRLLLAFVLSLLVFLGYQAYVTKYYPTPVRRVSSDTSVLVSAPDTTAYSSRPVASSTPLSSAPVPASPASQLQEETALLKGNGIEITTTSRGAGIKQIRLTGIPQIPHKDLRDVKMVEENWHDPLAAILGPGRESPDMFQTESVSEQKVSYRLTLSDAAGRPATEILRTMELGQNRFEVKLKTVLRNISDATLRYGTDSSTAFGVTVAPLPKKLIKTDLDLHEMYVKLGEDVEHKTEATPGFFDSLMGKKQTVFEEHRESVEGVLKWISVGDRYFTAVLIPDSPLARAFLFQQGPVLSAVAQYGLWQLNSGAERTIEETLYAGPKSPDNLKRYGKDLLEIMNFGWFDWMAFGMLWLMNLFHRLIPDFGVAIILLTVVVRIILYPLTHASYVSMAKMKDLAPKMKEIQEKFKENRERLNRELVKLYKDNKVNPAGGCLPILLQIPVFFAFYRMLQYAIELRGAEFLWIHDLSEKDPFYILPVLMGISMLIQQKMTPSADPTQAKIAMFMTIIFTFLFLTFPSGLNLYWFVSTVLGIWQQKLIEKKLKPPLPPPA